MNQGNIIDLLSDMSLISNVPKDHKINFTTKTYEAGWWAALKRRFAGENRIDCALRTNKIAVRICQLVQESQQGIEHKILFDEIPNFIAGIRVLIDTYEKEASASSAQAITSFRTTLKILQEIQCHATLNEYAKK